MTDHLDYYEELEALGINCPHEDAVKPDGVKDYYRVLKSNPATSESFLPTPLNANKPIPNGFDECIGKSVSVYDDLRGMINGFFKLPSNKGKKKFIGVLKLKNTDGRIKQTFDHKNHHSWWRSSDFDIATVTIQEFEI